MNFNPLRFYPLTLRPDYFRPGSLIIEASASDSLAATDTDGGIIGYSPSDSVAVTETLSAFMSSADLSISDSVAVVDYAIGYVVGATPVGTCWSDYAYVEIT